MNIYKTNRKLEEKQIAIFQKHLGDYMNIFKITTEELGQRLGVSRTQISNLKSGYSKMTKAQWIAIRVILSNSEDVVGDRFRKETIKERVKLQKLIDEESQ